MKKRIIISLVVVLLCILAGGMLWFHSVTSKIFIHPDTASASAPSIQQQSQTNNPFNILLLGYGGGNHDGAYLTDSIMVVHIDPKTKQVFLISVPRDLWVKIPTTPTSGNYSKINAAYAIGLDDTDYPNKPKQFTGSDGGGRLAEYMISQVTGLPIQYFVGMDFSGFTHTIDTLGGVNLTVEKTFDDYQYPIEGKEDDSCGLTDDAIASLSAQIASGSATELDAFPCRFEHLHFDAGPQHMDGTTALKYVRSRHSLQDGTDFGRASRQRNLIVAVKQEIFSAGFIPKIIPFMGSLGDDLRTDLSIDDVKTLLAKSSTYNSYKVSTLALTDQNYLKDGFSDDGQAILEPVDGLDNFTSIHNWLTNSFSGKSQPVAPVIEVENGTKVAGLAGLAVNRVKDLNLQVLDPGNADTQDVKKTTITVFDKNVDATQLTSLKKEFGVSQVTFAPTPTTQLNYNVLVIVGEDYNNKEGKKLLNEP